MPWRRASLQVIRPLPLSSYRASASPLPPEAVVAFFCLILPHSNVWFVKAYPRETTEAFLDGHVSAFAFLGGVARSILYDNTTLAVARILGDGTRRRRRRSHIFGRTTCSATASAGPARATTRARSRPW